MERRFVTTVMIQTPNLYHGMPRGRTPINEANLHELPEELMSFFSEIRELNCPHIWHHGVVKTSRELIAILGQGDSERDNRLLQLPKRFGCYSNLLFASVKWELFHNHNRKRTRSGSQLLLPPVETGGNWSKGIN